MPGTEDQVAAGPNELPKQLATKPRRSGFFTAGVYLTIAAGVLSIVNGVSSIFNYTESIQFELISELSHACAFVVVILGIISILSGLVTLKLGRVSPGLVGAVLGMIGGGYFGFWVGLGALVMFALSGSDL